MKEYPRSKEANVPNKRLSDAIIAKEPKSPKENRAFLKFLRESVTVKDLLSDRLAQAFLESILQDIPHSDRMSKKQSNPYPAIDYRYESGGGGFIHHSFMLKGDDGHLYFFDGWIRKETPFLRPQDIIPAEDYSGEKTPYHMGRMPGVPFKMPLMRAKISGGHTEHFDYNASRWEVDREGRINEAVDKEVIREANRVISSSGKPNFLSRIISSARRPN